MSTKTKRELKIGLVIPKRSGFVQPFTGFSIHTGGASGDPDPKRLGLLHPAHTARFMNTLPLSLPLLKALTPEPHRLEIVDENFDAIDFDGGYDLVGITVTTNVSPRAFEIAREFRGRGTQVVFGGIHPTLRPDHVRPHCDAIVAGEAEYLWPRVLEDAASGRLEDLYRADGFIDMADYPFIPKGAFPEGKEVLLVETTRGCPHRCDYCSVTAFHGNKFRMRPLEDVIRQVVEYRDKFVFFVDDNIAGVPKYAKELFRALRPLGISWSGQITLDRIDDDELLRLAAESGCNLLFAGLESLNPDSLGEVAKAWARPEKYAERIAKLHDAGIALCGAFMVGFDHDTTDVFARTTDFCDENEIELVCFSVVFPIVGTRLHERLSREGRIFETDPARFNGQYATFHPKRMTAEELDEGIRTMWKEFYSKRSIKRRFGRLSNRGLQPPTSLADIDARQFLMILNMWAMAALRRWS